MSARATPGAVVSALLLCIATAARAEDAPPAPAPKLCQLGQTGSLDLTTGGEGMVFLSGSVEGRSGKFLVDTGGLGLILGFSTATQLKEGPHQGFGGISMVGGVNLTYGVGARDFNVGAFKIAGAYFIVAPDRTFPSYAIGNIQPHSLWKNSDIEIDFWKSKLNLFLPNQCPGHVVYWTREPYAAVPMHQDLSGHIVVQANLDGKLIDAVVDTGAQRSFLSLKAASHFLDIDANTPGMTNRGTLNINEMVQAKRYHYPFRSLTFEGVAIANPDIEINDTGNDSKEEPLVLGIGVLRQLHLFIAYDENTLYLTAAEAH